MENKIKNSCVIVIFILIFIVFDNNIINDPDNLLVVVNKKYILPNNYIPENLKLLSLNYSYKNKFLRKEAKDAFENLYIDAYKLGYNIIVTSAYRDFDYQSKLFDYYEKKYGLDYALNCSAKPGHSEHQTGLAIDVEGSNKDYNKFSESKEFNWMKENAHKYGFILRYPKGKENITGFKYEPWHYRYVGIKHATYIYENNLTLEEYVKKNPF